MSNSSEFSSSEQRLQGQDHEALLRKTETLKSELERLQILNERLHGEGIKRLSRPELQSLESQMRQGLLKVEDQLAKKRIKLVEDERVLVKQESEDMGRELIKKKRNENLSQQLLLSKKRKNLRLMARELRRSPEETQQEHNHVALLSSIESMKREIKTLELLNKRMSGKELDSLGYFELMILRREIQYGLFNLKNREVNKKLDERRCKEELISELKMRDGGSGQIVPVAEHVQSSLDNGTNDHGSNISSRLRFLAIN